jgi:hypothetical protein
VALYNPGRSYMFIQNRDNANGVTFAVATQNQATGNHHYIPPGGFYEYGPVEPGWAPLGDISMIAVSGSPIINFLER